MHSTIEQQVRERAYQLWLRDGGAEGRDMDYWCAAERELLATADALPVPLPVAPPSKQKGSKGRAPRKRKK